ncbi:sulfotransferase family protein [Actibacterium lipolyticum]|uniref:Sulfotransferase domain protein n=1 Tax=Actibacterium lipolyticum TaxID=1524263 RepID=A0A238KX70_9RHOB|nr:sulfotransferase [Actibacterium lipolyticum]SMX47288.1 Sulfotransferase domain protein [Actibacterium lipolyticum]
MIDRPVDFLIIGAAKCATTWLQNSLQNDPSIFMPDAELHFFSREYDRGLDWYTNHFTPRDDSVILGEKSNSYLTEEDAAQRIKDTYPNARLILQMRNPVARAYSDYCMLYRRGAVSADIEKHLDPDIAADQRFIHNGRYGHHMTRFLKLFPAEQFLFLFFENVKVAPETQLAQIANHIGFEGTLSPPLGKKVKDRRAAMVPRPLRAAIKPLRPLLDPLRNTAPMKSLRNMVAKPVVYPPITPQLVEKLDAYFRPDVKLLEEIMGKDLSDWMDNPGL